MINRNVGQNPYLRLIFRLIALVFIIFFIFLLIFFGIGTWQENVSFWIGIGCLISSILCIGISYAILRRFYRQKE